MKTAEERDAMVLRVQETYEKWPAFGDMPIATWGETAAEVDKPPLVARIEEPSAYIAALYAVCMNSDVLGRAENTIAGEKIVEPPKEEEPPVEPPPEEVIP